VVDSLRARIGAERFVLVDAGNIHGFKQDEVAGREADFIVRMMNHQKYDVSVLGPKDHALKDSVRASLLAGAAFPWIGTNFTEAGRPKGVQEVWIQKVDGVRVGLFSYIDPSWVANNAKSDFITDNLESTARELKKKCDVVALVCYTDVNNPEPVARRVNGLVDVMILGGVNSPWMTPRREGGVTIGNSGDRGRHIARFDLLLNKERKVVATDYQVVVLGHDLPVDPAVTALMDEFKAEQDRVRLANLEKLRQTKLASLGIDPASLPGADSPLAFVGEKECRDCHVEEHASWRQSMHGRTFSDLIRNRESEQEMKVKRAVTGWMETTGYVDRRESSHLYNVQCESCHGRGSEHVRTKGGALETLVKPETTCLRCHSPEQTPNFDLAAGLKMAHPPVQASPPPGASPAGGPKAALTPGTSVKVEPGKSEKPADSKTTNKNPDAAKPVAVPNPRTSTPVSPPPDSKKN
jgi:hypothetical protein